MRYQLRVISPALGVNVRTSICLSYHFRIVPDGSFPEAKDYLQVWDKVKTAFPPRLDISPHPLAPEDLDDFRCTWPNTDLLVENQPLSNLIPVVEIHNYLRSEFFQSKFLTSTLV